MPIIKKEKLFRAGIALLLALSLGLAALVLTSGAAPPFLGSDPDLLEAARAAIQRDLYALHLSP